MTPQLQRGKSAAVLRKMATLDIWGSPQDMVIPPCRLFLLPLGYIHFFCALFPLLKHTLPLIYCHSTHGLHLLFLLFPLIRSHVITSPTEGQVCSEGTEQDSYTAEHTYSMGRDAQENSWIMRQFTKARHLRALRHTIHYCQAWPRVSTCTCRTISTHLDDWVIISLQRDVCLSVIKQSVQNINSCNQNFNYLNWF